MKGGTLSEEPCMTLKCVGLRALVCPTSTQIQQLGISANRVSMVDRATKEFSSPKGLLSEMNYKF